MARGTEMKFVYCFTGCADRSSPYCPREPSRTDSIVKVLIRGVHMFAQVDPNQVHEIEADNLASEVSAVPELMSIDEIPPDVGTCIDAHASLMGVTIFNHLVGEGELS